MKNGNEPSHVRQGWKQSGVYDDCKDGNVFIIGSTIYQVLQRLDTVWQTRKYSALVLSKEREVGSAFVLFCLFEERGTIKTLVLEPKKITHYTRA